MAEEEVSTASLREIARRAGLDLSDEELEAVRPGVLRNLAWAKVVRKWAAADVEPATAPVEPPAP